MIRHLCIKKDREMVSHLITAVESHVHTVDILFFADYMPFRKKNKRVFQKNKEEEKGL